MLTVRLRLLCYSPLYSHENVSLNPATQQKLVLLTFPIWHIVGVIVVVFTFAVRVAAFLARVVGYPVTNLTERMIKIAITACSESSNKQSNT